MGYVRSGLLVLEGLKLDSLNVHDDMQCHLTTVLEEDEMKEEKEVVEVWVVFVGRYGLSVGTATRIDWARPEPTRGPWLLVQVNEGRWPGKLAAVRQVSGSNSESIVRYDRPGSILLDSGGSRLLLGQ